MSTGTYLSADHIAAELQPENPAEARLQAGRLFLKRFRRMGKRFIRALEG